MPTVIRRTVGTASRNYATISLAESDVSSLVGSSNLVTADKAVIFDIYNDASYDERVIIAGNLTCDATRNVTYNAASGQQHTGTQGTGVQVKPTAAGTHVFQIRDEFTVLDGLEITLTDTAANTSAECVRVGNSTQNPEGSVIRNCLIYTSDNTQAECVYGGNYNCGTSTNPITVENCVLSGGTSRAAFHAQMSSAANIDHYWNIVNCTFHDNNIDIGFDIDDPSSSLTIKVINCLTTGSTGGEFDDTHTRGGTLTTTGSEYNFGTWGASDTGDGFPGAATYTQITTTDNTAPGAGTWAIFADISSPDSYDDDLALVDDTDNDVLDSGVGPASNSLVPTTDILGNTRSGTTADPGAFQVTAAGGGGTTETLTVVSGTGTLGDLTDSRVRSDDLTAVSATGTLASLTDSRARTDALTTVTGTGTLGDLTDSRVRSDDLTVVTGTGTLGDLTDSRARSEAVTLVSASGTLGDLTDSRVRSDDLTTVTGTGTLADLTTGATRSESLSTIAATGTLADLTDSRARTDSLTLVSATGTLGDLTTGATRSESLSTIAATGTLGDLTDSRARADALTTVAATGTLGDLTAVGGKVEALTSVSGAGTLGDLTDARARADALTTVAGTGTLADLSTQQGVSELLETVLASPSLTDLSVAAGVDIELIAAEGVLGEVVPGVAIDVTIVEAQTAISDLSVVASVPLEQVQSAAALGDITVPAAGVVSNLGTVTAVVTLPDVLNYEFLVANSQRIYRTLHEIISAGPFYEVHYDTDGRQSLVSTDPVAPASVVLNETDASFGDSRVRSKLRFARTQWSWVAYVDFRNPVTVGAFEEKWLRNPSTLSRDENNDLDAVIIEFNRAVYRHPAHQGPETGTSYELTFFATPLEG